VLIVFIKIDGGVITLAEHVWKAVAIFTKIGQVFDDEEEFEELIWSHISYERFGRRNK